MEKNSNEINITNKSSEKSIDIIFESPENVHKQLPIDRQLTKIGPGETKTIPLLNDGRCISLNIYGMASAPRTGSGWYMVPICDSPILVYPEESKVEYKGHSLPKIEYDMLDKTVPSALPQTNPSKHTNWLLYIFLIIMCVLLYFAFAK
ncbi:MAG TPA: hypothetical protein PKD85_00330 [Saprospiraceae bacterium]|nr:hypothetical protein [Saprospiraceae bacterium]